MKIFNYNIDIFDLQLLVCVGSNENDIKKWADKNGTKEFKILVKQGLPMFNDNTHNSGFVYRTTDKNGLSYYILWLKKHDNSWECLDTLLHEIIHIKQEKFKACLIEDEREFEAYFVEYLFRVLRRELVKRLKLNK